MTEVAENLSEETQVAEESVSMFGENGDFAENWMEAANVPEDLRGDLTLKSTKSVAGLASQLVNAQKLIGKNADMVVVPNEKSSETEWSDFYKATGRPDTPDEYEITHMEELGEVDSELESAFKNLAHSEGLRPSTVQKLIEMDDNRIMAMRTAFDNAKIQEAADAEEALKKQWGSAYEERLHLANRMIAENVSDDNKQGVLDAIGNNPYVADFLANIAKKFVEHKIISADVNAPTPVEALAKADELRNTPGYLNGELSKTSPARHKQITLEISKIMEHAYPESS